MFRSLPTVVGCLCLILPVRADECDRIVENLLAHTPGLQLDKRMLAEGVDIVYLKRPKQMRFQFSAPHLLCRRQHSVQIGLRTFPRHPIFNSLANSAASSPASLLMR